MINIEQSLRHFSPIESMKHGHINSTPISDSTMMSPFQNFELSPPPSEQDISEIDLDKIYDLKSHSYDWNNDTPTTQTTIKVLCRIRPKFGVSNNRLSEFQDQTLSVFKHIDTHYVELIPPLEKNGSSNFRSTNRNNKTPRQFVMDYVFPEDSTQNDVFKRIGLPCLESVFQGINSTILAYGQTGSGKTHTLIGGIESLSSSTSQNLDPTTDSIPSQCGLIPRLILHCFFKVEELSTNYKFKLKISIIEIYNEIINDLITSKTNLKSYQNFNPKSFPSQLNSIHGTKTSKSSTAYKFNVKDLSEHVITSPEEAYKLLNLALNNRKIAYTKSNAESSRSHLIFMLEVLQVNKIDGTRKSSSMYIVDLAGSEKAESATSSINIQEGKMINRSLSCLSNVVHILSLMASDKNKLISHVPYRDSKLTQILKNSLGGDSKTYFILNCAPENNNYFETLYTLRFGQRAKCVKNLPTVNTDITTQSLQPQLKLHQDLLYHIIQWAILILLYKSESLDILHDSNSQSEFLENNSDLKPKHISLLPSYVPSKKEKVFNSYTPNSKTPTSSPPNHLEMFLNRKQWEDFWASISTFTVPALEQTISEIRSKFVVNDHDGQSSQVTIRIQTDIFENFKTKAERLLQGSMYTLNPCTNPLSDLKINSTCKSYQSALNQQPHKKNNTTYLNSSRIDLSSCEHAMLKSNICKKPNSHILSTSHSFDHIFLDKALTTPSLDIDASLPVLDSDSVPLLHSATSDNFDKRKMLSFKHNYNSFIPSPLITTYNSSTNKIPLPNFQKTSETNKKNMKIIPSSEIANVIEEHHNHLPIDSTSINLSTQKDFINSLDRSLDNYLDRSLNSYLDRSLDNYLDNSLDTCLNISLDNPLEKLSNSSLNTSPTSTPNTSTVNSPNASPNNSPDTSPENSLIASPEKSLDTSHSTTLDNSPGTTLVTSLNATLYTPQNSLLDTSPGTIADISPSKTLDILPKVPAATLPGIPFYKSASIPADILTGTLVASSHGTTIATSPSSTVHNSPTTPPATSHGTTIDISPATPADILPVTPAATSPVIPATTSPVTPAATSHATTIDISPSSPADISPFTSVATLHGTTNDISPGTPATTTNATTINISQSTPTDISSSTPADISVDASSGNSRNILPDNSMVNFRNDNFLDYTLNISVDKIFQDTLTGCRQSREEKIINNQNKLFRSKESSSLQKDGTENENKDSKTSSAWSNIFYKFFNGCKAIFNYLFFKKKFYPFSGIEKLKKQNQLLSNYSFIYIQSTLHSVNTSAAFKEQDLSKILAATLKHNVELLNILEIYEKSR